MSKIKQFIVICTSLILTGCSSQHSYIYNDNKKIATNNCYSMKMSSQNLEDNNTTLSFKSKKFNGCFEIATYNVENKTDTELHVTVNANKGKIKLVLVKDNSQIEVLKEVISNKENEYNDTIKITCNSKKESLKLVGNDFSGTFKITQPNDMPFIWTDVNENEFLN